MYWSISSFDSIKASLAAHNHLPASNRATVRMNGGEWGVRTLRAERPHYLATKRNFSMRSLVLSQDVLLLIQPK